MAEEQSSDSTGGSVNSSDESTTEDVTSHPEQEQTTPDPTESDHEAPFHVRVSPPRRKVVIEPVWIMYHIFSSPLKVVTHYYTIDRMSEIVAHRTGYNLSTPTHHAHHAGNPCHTLNNSSHTDYNFTQQVQAEVAHFQMIGQLVTVPLSLIAMLILGSYSDKAGRKIIIVPFIAAEFIGSLIVLFCLYFHLTIWILLVQSLIVGLSGGSSLMKAGCYAYIADTTPKEGRFFRFTVLLIISDVLAIIDPIGVGQWIKQQGYLWPMVFSASGCFVNCIYVTLFVPETVARNSSDSRVKCFTFSYVKETAKLFMKNDQNNRRWKLWLLFMVTLINQLARGVESPFALLKLNLPYCWDSVTLGYYNAVHGVVVTVGGLLFSKVLKSVLTDGVIAVVASMGDVMENVFRLFIVNSWMMFAELSFKGLTVSLMPTVRAVLSKQVTSSQQGSIFGAVAFVEALSGLCGKELFTYIYASTLLTWHALIFLLAAAIYVCSTVLCIVYVVRSKREERQYQRLETLG